MGRPRRKNRNLSPIYRDNDIKDGFHPINTQGIEVAAATRALHSRRPVLERYRGVSCWNRTDGNPRLSRFFQSFPDNARKGQGSYVSNLDVSRAGCLGGWIDFQRCTDDCPIRRPVSSSKEILFPVQTHYNHSGPLFGQPVRKANPGAKEIYYYQDMKVVFTNGKVGNVE